MKIYKEYINHYEGGDALIIDERNFNDVQTFQLKIIREKAMELILAIAPDYKQRNAALGLLSEQETQQIKDNIQNIRNISNSLEQQILNVSWDGDESTRSTACDSVQNIIWP
jgi:hypothetical protein